MFFSSSDGNCISKGSKFIALDFINIFCERGAGQVWGAPVIAIKSTSFFIVS